MLDLKKAFASQYWQEPLAINQPHNIFQEYKPFDLADLKKK